MPFSNHQDQSSEVDPDQALKKQELDSHIENLGKTKLAMEKDIATASAKELVVEDLNKKIIELTTLKEDIEKELSSKRQELVNIGSSLLELGKQIKDHEQVLAGVSKAKEDFVVAQVQLDNLTVQLSSTKNELKKNQDDLLAKQSEIKNLMSQEQIRLSELASSFNAKNSELRNILSLIEEKKKELSDLENEESLVNKKLSLQKSKMDEAINFTGNLVKESLKKKTEQDAELEQQKKDFESGISAEIAQRESDLTQREGWLEEKKQSLISIKTELEKFHGKKINIII